MSVQNKPIQGLYAEQLGRWLVVHVSLEEHGGTKDDYCRSRGQSGVDLPLVQTELSEGVANFL